MTESILGYFLPFVLSTFILLSIIFLVTKLTSLINLNISNKTRKIIIAIYLGILLISFPILHLLPSKGLNDLAFEPFETDAGTGTIDFYTYNRNKFYESASQGKLNELAGVYKNAEAEFSTTSNFLKFNVPPASANYKIWVQKKSTADGKIEVSSYVSGYVLDNTNFSAVLSPPKITLNGSTLDISYIDKNIEIKFLRFGNDYPIHQFTSPQNSNIFYQSSLYGYNAIIVRIPANMSVEEGLEGVNVIE